MSSKNIVFKDEACCRGRAAATRIVDAMRVMPNCLRVLPPAAVILALLTGTLLTGPAAAQMPMPSLSLGGGGERKLTPEEREKQEAIDKAYRAANGKIPDKKVDDPWADVRSSAHPAPAKKKPQ
jgi:hypothetical protein